MQAHETADFLVLCKIRLAPVSFKKNEKTGKFGFDDGLI